jgi:hypothetical protein
MRHLFLCFAFFPLYEVRRLSVWDLFWRFHHNPGVIFFVWGWIMTNDYDSTVLSKRIFLLASCGKLYISLRIEFETSNGLELKWDAIFENSCTLELK